MCGTDMASQRNCRGTKRREEKNVRIILGCKKGVCHCLAERAVEEAEEGGSTEVVSKSTKKIVQQSKSDSVITMGKDQNFQFV